MGDIKYIEGAVRELDKNSVMDKFAIQGNIISKLLIYWGYDIGTDLQTSVVKNGKPIDLLLTYKSIELPISLFSYDKDTRGVECYKGRNTNIAESLLNQFAEANKLKIGLMTDGYLFFFYSYGKEKKILNELTILDILSMKKGKKDFFDSFSKDKIEHFYETFTEITLRDVVFREWNLRKSVFVNNVSKSYGKSVEINDIEKELSFILSCQYVQDNNLENVYNSNNFNDSNEVVEKVENDLEVFWHSEKNLKKIKPILNKKKMSDSEKLKGLNINPKKFCVGEDEPILFTKWVDIYVFSLNRLWMMGKEKYYSYVRELSNNKTVRIFSSDMFPNDEEYQKYINESKSKKLLSGDLLETAADRITICRHVLDILRYINPKNAYLTLIYAPDASFTIRYLGSVGATKKLHINTNTDNKSQKVDSGSLEKEEEIKKITLKDLNQKISSDKVKLERGDIYQIKYKNKVFGTYQFLEYRQSITDLLNSVQDCALEEYKKLKTWYVGSNFFIITPQKIGLVKEYHTERKLKNGDKFVIHTDKKESVILLNAIANEVGIEIIPMKVENYKVA